jgi:hypothetical protein
VSDGWAVTTMQEKQRHESPPQVNNFHDRVRSACSCIHHNKRDWFYWTEFNERQVVHDIRVSIVSLSDVMVLSQAKGHYVGKEDVTQQAEVSHCGNSLGRPHCNQTRRQPPRSNRRCQPFRRVVRCVRTRGHRPSNVWAVMSMNV